MLVPSEQLQKAREYVAQHKNINWYSDPFQLDESAIVEGVLTYGTWEDFTILFNLFGPVVFKGIFSNLIDTKHSRQNLKPRTINYFSRYLDRYV